MKEDSYPMCNYPNPYKKKKVIVTRPNQYLASIFGIGQDVMRSRLYFSTEKITLARFQVMPGSRFSPPDNHSGDEIYYIISGTAYVFNPATGKTTIGKKGDFMNVPKNVWHQAFNFSDEILDVLCIVAPVVEDDDLQEIVSSYKEKPKYF
jgi:mannose-6-phosphate isomerase-like protein (cupin superfamily)